MYSVWVWFILLTVSALVSFLIGLFNYVIIRKKIIKRAYVSRSFDLMQDVVEFWLPIVATMVIVHFFSPAWVENATSVTSAFLLSIFLIMVWMMVNFLCSMIGEELSLGHCRRELKTIRRRSKINYYRIRRMVENGQ